MKTRKKIAVVGINVTLFLAMLFIAGNLFAVSHSERFDVNDLEFSVEERGYDVIRLADLLVTTERGEPELPVKLVNLIIPCGREVDDIDITVNQQTLEGTYFINPSPGPIPITEMPEPAEPDPAIYNSSNIFPEDCVEVLSHGYFDGANRIVSLAIYPVQYIPADSILKFNESIYFTLSFKSSGPPIAVPNFRLEKNVELYENVLRSIVENDEDVNTYKHQPTILTEPRENDVEMFVIGDSKYEDDFNDFIEWKRKKGIIVEYKTIQSICNEYPEGDYWHDHPIVDMAGSMRAFLREMYQDSCLTYALIVGGETDFDSIPAPNDDTISVRYACLNNNTWCSHRPEDTWAPHNTFDRIPTDLYFSDFNGDYDVEGDPIGYYGEPNDSIDKYPEIFVGRLVVSSQGEVDNHEQIRLWIEKLITYETNPGYGDFDYLAKTVLFNGFVRRDAPYTLYNGEFDNLLIGNFDFYEEVEPIHSFPPSSPYGGFPNGTYVIYKMNENYGFVHFYWHGNKFLIDNYVRSDSFEGYTVCALDKYDEYEHFPYPEPENGFDNLNQDENGKYNILYAASCRVGGYDKCDNTPDEYWGNRICMAESFTSYNKGGGPAMIGHTHVGGSPHFEEYLLRSLFENNCFHIGAALAEAKTHAFVISLLDASLFGDPEMPVWTEVPSYLEVAHNYEEHSVTVTSDGVPVEGASVFFENPDSGDTLVYTDANGFAQSPFSFNEVTVTKHNFIPYIAHIALNGELWSGETDLKWLTIVPPGRTLNINGTLNLSELGGKNAKIIVEEGGTLNINNDAVILGNRSTYYPDGSSPIQVIIPGNCIEVFGDITLGENVVFTAPEGESWDGLYLYNTDAEVAMNNVTFERCKLHNGSLLLNITSSDFTNSGIEQSGDVLELYNTNFDNSPLSCNWKPNKSNPPDPLHIEVDVNNCYFENCSDYAVKITNYPLYELQNNTITNCGGGFDISYSGNPRKCIISDNYISNNSGYGIFSYDSYVDICDNSTDWGQNVIENNSGGIVGIHNSSISIIGNPDYPHSTIQDNEAQELYFDPSSFPEKICYNKIIDDNYIAGSTDQYLIFCKNYTGGDRELIVENNYWGPESEDWIEWTGDNRFSPGDAYDYIPVWIPGPPVNPSQGTGAKALYADADSLIQIEEYEAAKQVYKDIIEQYPESNYAIYSMRNLLPLETVSGQDFTALQEYYLTDPNCNYNDERTKLSEYLANWCNIKMEEYPVAITFFEDIIEDPDTELDSVYAVIDAGYTYLLMGDEGGKSGFVGRMPELKPKSLAEFEKTRDELLAKVLGLPEQDEEESIPENIFYLAQNYPNPCTHNTTISYAIPKAGNVSLKVYNIKGQLVKTIVDEHKEEGHYAAIWDGKDDNGKPVSSGIYFYRLETDNSQSQIRKMLLIR